jgi:signal transduction histidine kinase/CheY-like chemotaxis protein
MAKILLAEDERDICDLIAFTLRFAGHEVFAASNGEEAVEMGPKVMPDLFLLDVRMPRMTGYETCKKLLAIPETRRIPVVFLSAKGQESDIIKGLVSGATEYLLKPFAPDQLVERVNTILEKAELGLFGKKTDKVHSQDDYDRFIDYHLEDSRSKLLLMQDMLNNYQETQESLNRANKEIEKLNSRLEEEKDSNRGSNKKDTKPQISQPDDRYIRSQVGRLTSGIVHDLRNGFGFIGSGIDDLMDDLANTSNERDILKISKYVNFCEVVLRNLAALGGREVMRPKAVNLDKVVREICFMLENKLVDVELVVDTGGREPIIMVDEGHMKQVFMNLIKNAGEAMKEGGTLTFRFRQKENMMQVEISDTGVGMSNEIQKRLFKEPYTNKEGGYGIGLFVVHSIVVDQYKGKIRVKSRENSGTTFTLLLPMGE